MKPCFYYIKRYTGESIIYVDAKRKMITPVYGDTHYFSGVRDLEYFRNTVPSNYTVTKYNTLEKAIANMCFDKL